MNKTINMEQQMQAGGIKRHCKSKVVAGRKKTHHWFTVVARNNQVLVTSETYKTKPSMEKGIEALKTAISVYVFNETK